MEQIQQLLELLKQTPEMALWGMVIYFLFILLKLASWVYALKVIAQQFINRYFNYRDNSINSKRGIEIAEMFEKQKLTGVDYSLLIELLNSVKNNNLYIHESDIKNAIKKLNTNK